MGSRTAVIARQLAPLGGLLFVVCWAGPAAAGSTTREAADVSPTAQPAERPADNRLVDNRLVDNRLVGNRLVGNRLVGNRLAEPPPANPPCIAYVAEARYRIGYDHLVRISNGCEATAECTVSTNVNPTPVSVQVRAGTTETVLTYRGSPASRFVAHVECALVS